MDHSEVIVIGAGIAGLTAAFYLQQLGFSVIILEESERPGGRVFSKSSEHGTFEIGAQFFHQEYLDTLQLVKDAKLLPKTYNIPFTVGIYDSKCLKCNAHEPLQNETFDALSNNRIFRMDRIYWPLQRRLMPLQARKQCFSFVSKMSRQRFHLFSDTHTSFTNSECLDQVTIRQWMEHHGFEEFYRHIIAPTIRALFFGDPDEMSAQHIFSHMGNRLQPWKLWSLEGGVSTLVETIKRQLIIFYKHKVHGIRIDNRSHGEHTSLFNKDPIIVVNGENEGALFQLRANFVVCANYGNDTLNWLNRIGVLTGNQPSIQYYGTQVGSFCIQNQSQRLTLPYSGIFCDSTSHNHAEHPFSSFVSYPYGRVTLFSKHETRTDHLLAFLGQNGSDLSDIQEVTTYMWRRAIPAFLPGNITIIRNWLELLAEWRRQNHCFVHVCGDWTQLGCVEGAIRSGRRVVDEIIGLRKHSVLEKN